MKKILSFMLAGLILCSTGTITASAKDSTKVGIETKYHILKSEYEKAVESKDENRQLLIEDIVNQKYELEYQEMIDNKNNLSSPITPFGWPIDDELESIYHSNISSSSWISRGGVMSLSIYPKSSFFNVNSVWNSIVYKQGQSRYWYNEPSLYKQFLCHYNFAGPFKTPWNLEPSNTNPNPITCN